MESAALTLIDRLMCCWNNWDSDEDYYLNEYAPRIVQGSVELTGPEKEISAKLRELLSEEEWSELPTLIARRRAEEAEIEQKRGLLSWLRGLFKPRRARKRELLSRLGDTFETSFLAADGILASEPDAGLIGGDEYAGLKARFVQDWAARELGESLDFEQAAAVAAIGSDVQVIARAGSGKTRTLVTRAIFLRKHCRLPSRDILLLAFNKRAAEEMKDRLQRALGDDLPHVMTFHALAYALVQPEEEIIFDDTAADQLGHSRKVQESIDTLLNSDEYGNRVRDLMLAHFREDWEQIVNGRFEMKMDEFLAYQRSLPRESLNGEYVKSFGEKTIANTLCEYGIKYKYERNYRWDGINYRPDFTVFNGSGNQTRT